VGLEWSPALARFSDARRGKLIDDIAAGRAALVRIDAASGLTQFSGSASIALPSGPVHATILGPRGSAIRGCRRPACWPW